MSINKEELELLRLAYDIKLLGLDEEKFLQFAVRLRLAVNTSGLTVHNKPLPTLDDLQQSIRDQQQGKTKVYQYQQEMVAKIMSGSNNNIPTDPSGAPMNAPTNPQPFNPNILQRSVAPGKDQMIVPQQPVASANPVQRLAQRGPNVGGQR